MNEIRLSSGDLNELDRMARAASSETWQWGHSATETIEEALVYASDNIIKSAALTDSADLWLVFIGDPDVENGTRLVAVSGNGPTSKANSEYIAAVRPEVILGLLNEVRQYRHLITLTNNDLFGKLPQ